MSKYSEATLNAEISLMECIPFLYFLVICGVLYLIGRQNGPDCLERAARYAEENGKSGGLVDWEC
jgi:hypothetical protein